MNLKICIIFLLTLLASSCTDRHEGEVKPTLLSNALSITKNEDKGVKEILDFYGGYCKYAVGVSASISDGNRKYFELELSKSEVIDQREDSPLMPASHVAYLFYKNLDEQERRNYDEIHSVLIFSSGERQTFKYATSDLELVANRMVVVNNVSHLLKSRDYDALKSRLNDSTFFSYDKNYLISKIKDADLKYGNVTDGFKPFGFYITQSKSGLPVVHIAGAMIRDKQNHEFSVDLPLEKDNEEIYLLQYKL